MRGMDKVQFWGETLRLVVELSATAAFALAGVIEAARKRLDAVGVCVVGFLTAFGGGQPPGDAIPPEWSAGAATPLVWNSSAFSGAAPWVYTDATGAPGGFGQTPDAIVFADFGGAAGAGAAGTSGQPAIVDWLGEILGGGAATFDGSTLTAPVNGTTPLLTTPGGSLFG